MKINIYINVAILGNVSQVLNDLLEKIKCCGLYESCSFIKLAVNGDISLLKVNFYDDLGKLIIIHTASNAAQYEFPALKLLWDDSQKNDCHILYLHTKGVSKYPNEKISDWVNYLSYFNITKWRERVSDLDSYDCSGVNLYGNQDSLQTDPSNWAGTHPPVHYSGNFWWSNSVYIRQLPEPYKWLPDNNYGQWRIMAEMWVCQLNGKFRSAWQSHVNHYKEPYPGYMYIDDKHLRIIIKRKAYQLLIYPGRIMHAFNAKFHNFQYFKPLKSKS